MALTCKNKNLLIQHSQRSLSPLSLLIESQFSTKTTVNNILSVNQMKKLYSKNISILYSILLIFILQLTTTESFLLKKPVLKQQYTEFDVCCTSQDKLQVDHFCQAVNTLSNEDQYQFRHLLRCPIEGENVIKKRKPNFIRYGRSIGNSRRLSDPNFLRFGRSWEETNDDNSFGKSASDPNFLRFGKRSLSIVDTESAEPNFLRFGRQFSPNNNFLRFGKRDATDLNNNFVSESFDREYRKPNFLRFG